MIIGQHKIRDVFMNSKAHLGLYTSYFFDAVAVFGFLGILSVFFADQIGLNDIQAGKMVGFLTAGVSLGSIVFGTTVDFLGTRRSLLIGLTFLLIGRLLPGIFIFGTSLNLWKFSNPLIFGSILLIIIGYGIYQTSMYSSIKRISHPKKVAINFAVLYSITNLGAFLPGIISPIIRKNYGITSLFYFYAGITLLSIIVITVMVTNQSLQRAIRTNSHNLHIDVIKEESIQDKVINSVKNFPLKDPRFLLFIILVIPVQTLIAHNWLTIPLFVKRSFPGFVSDNFELFASLNPLLVFIMAPAVTAFSAKYHPYRVIIVGTLLMALSPFSLGFKVNLYTLIFYIFFMTLGEVIWQPRFSQWVSSLAPSNMTGIYLGIAELPWFCAKALTSLYSGWFLMKFCPNIIVGRQGNPSIMWLLYGIIAVISPLGLIGLSKWMMKTKH